ncbi:hypothetical protein OG21DRAFT_1514731 [Imleria badia]|nr:hypothetical protein OG21DRAFT_1514731 [Imleria badia]
MRLENGKYHIIPHGIRAPPPFPVGANNLGGPVDPVVVAGINKVWIVRKVSEDKYVLILEQGGRKWIGYGQGDNVLVGEMPQVAEWAIRERKPEENAYSIEEPSDRWPTRAWAVESTLPETKVKLRIFELPEHAHLWTFHYLGPLALEE